MLYKLSDVLKKEKLFVFFESSILSILDVAVVILKSDHL